jgi:hypothetical protein
LYSTSQASRSAWQLIDRAIDLFAERDPAELVQRGAMGALANAVGSRALGLGAAVIDVLDGEIELVFMAFATAELGAASDIAPVCASLPTAPPTERRTPARKPRSRPAAAWSV